MSAEYSGPRIGDTVAVHAGPLRIVELAARGGVLGVVVVGSDDVRVWVPLSWTARVHDATRGGAR
ncbi:hypothetical protein ACU61A_09405 [Pseudonocardia sichuanensis]